MILMLKLMETMLSNITSKINVLERRTQHMDAEVEEMLDVIEGDQKEGACAPEPQTADHPDQVAPKVSVTLRARVATWPALDLHRTLAI